MAKERITLLVHVDLDPVPGAFHDREDARVQIANILRQVIPHYNPIVMNVVGDGK